MSSLPAPLDSLDAHARHTLARYLEVANFTTGDIILRAGEEGSECFIIDSGTIRIETARVEIDTEGVVEYLGAGDILGELSLLDGQPRSASAIAHSDVSARRITDFGLERLCSEHPPVGIAVLKAFGRQAAQRLRAVNRRLSEVAAQAAPDPEVEDLVGRAVAAQRRIESWPEARIDALLEKIAHAVAREAGPLAQETVAETKVGNAADKTTKNLIASLGVLQSLAGEAGGGVIRHIEGKSLSEIAAPAGVIFAIIPMTNPVATAIYKTLIALKGRNALILSFHRLAMGVGARTGALIHQAIVDAGAPADLVQWVKHRGSRRKTQALMTHDKVALILATGGASMVRAAYSSGTPAIGVGPGNTPTWICADADLAAAAQRVVVSKSFDNGLICGAEHNLVVDQKVAAAFASALVAAGAAVLEPAEVARFSAAAIDPETGHFRGQLVGQSAARIAKVAGITRDYPIRVIVAPADPADLTGPWADEKMAPLLSFFTVKDDDAALALCRNLLDINGTGHTAIIHSADESRIERFALAMPASRILVNSPGSHGVCGVTSGLEPSFTLGCGTFGGTSTTDNVTFRNLINVKRLARYRDPVVPRLG